ncbi:hypothetical protein QJS10_CPA02g00850 [Acorus calamus]|uniref:Uncharacterized protein n=1 Tax=Acorus calamus TaxID=4465 RepID=A0AAV9FE85_ACOCL|nr:hypothetical protein QJS10_CPA02g00850 [Acorus calamus]
MEDGPLDGREHEFEDESLVSPASLTRKAHVLDSVQHGSFGEGMGLLLEFVGYNSIGRAIGIHYRATSIFHRSDE